MPGVWARKGHGSRDGGRAATPGFPEEAIENSVPLLIVGGPRRNLWRRALEARRFTPPQEALIRKHRVRCPTVSYTRPHRGVPVTAQDNMIRLRRPPIDDGVY